MNKDLHLELLLKMNLEDIRHFCQLSSYYTSLCHTPILINKLNQAKQKANIIMKLLGNRIKLITNQNFIVFYKLMNHLNIGDYSTNSIDVDMDFFVNNIIVDRFVINIYLFYNSDDFTFQVNIYGNEYKKFEEFLLHGFYNHYIIGYELDDFSAASDDSE